LDAPFSLEVIVGLRTAAMPQGLLLLPRMSPLALLLVLLVVVVVVVLLLLLVVLVVVVVVVQIKTGAQTGALKTSYPSLFWNLLGVP